MARGDQLSRQCRLLQMIDHFRSVTVDDAALELGCAPHTIWRDLDALQQAGFPLYSERASDGYRGLWRVREEFKRSLPLKLILGELAALVMSRSLLAPLGAGLPAARWIFGRCSASGRHARQKHSEYPDE